MVFAMASSLVPGCQVMSDLLTIREKGVLYALLEPQCQLVKSTVAQVLVAEEKQDGRPGWSCLGCGVLCLTEDQSVHAYFLQLYCIKRTKLLWQEEVYIPFKYTATHTFFHTFPADGHQAGLNFASEVEAKEFHQAVEAVRRNQEKMTRMTFADRDHNSTFNLPDSGVKPVDCLDEEQHSPTTFKSKTISHLDSTMRKLLIQARLTEEDLIDKEISEAVDCIINRFGGLQVVKRELSNRGLLSQTLPRGAKVSNSQSLRKVTLPQDDSIKSSRASRQTPLDQSCLAARIPTPPSARPPIVAEWMRTSVGSPTASESTSPRLTALTDVFKQGQLLQRSTDEERVETE